MNDALDSTLRYYTKQERRLMDELHESIMMAHGCVNISEDSPEKYLATKTKHKDEVPKKTPSLQKPIHQLLGKMQDLETALADETFRVRNLTHTDKYQLISCALNPIELSYQDY